MTGRLYGSMLLAVALLTTALAQTAGEPEFVSPRGVKFYALPDDKNQVAEAEKKLAADPKNVELIIALGRAQAAVWRYRDAIDTYTRGIKLYPSRQRRPLPSGWG